MSMRDAHPHEGHDEHADHASHSNHTDHEAMAGDHECCGPGYASPEEAMKAEPEKLLYTVALYAAPTSGSRTTWRRSMSIPRRRPTRR